MKKMIILAAIAASLSMQARAAETTEKTNADKKEAPKELKLADVMSKPKISGYLIGNYNATFQEGKNSNTFSIRLIRLTMTGRILNDFEYKLQGQLNGNSSTFGESPRMVDMSLEWLRHKEFKVKIGQFKRPFSFENPMNPIVNCAAYTAVDKAETNKELCTSLNTVAPAYLAAAVEKRGGWMIQISTDYVFNGKGHTPYREDDTPSPHAGVRTGFPFRMI